LDEASRTADRPPETPPNPPDRDAAENAVEFLQSETERAQLALTQSLHDLTARLRECADVRDWTREYPWAGVGTAAVVGFALAAAVIPIAREKSESDEERRPAPAASAPPPKQAAAASTGKSAIIVLIINLLFGFAKSAVGNVLSSTLSQAMHGPPEREPHLREDQAVAQN
jgi:hypothetical protein